MQGSLQRMRSNVRAEKQACMRVYEIFIVIYITMIPLIAFTGDMAASFIYVILGIMTVILSLRLFRDMHSSTQADVILSLPMTAKERYFSKLLVFIRCAVIPYFICGGLSLIAVFITARKIYESTNRSFGDYAAAIGIMFLAGLSVMMFCAAITFICCTFTSHVAFGAVSSAAGILALAMIPYTFFETIALPSAGIRPEEYYKGGTIYNIIGVNSVIDVFKEQDGSFMDLQPGKWACFTAASILISTIILMSGYLVYKRRDKSTITYNTLSKPFVLVITALAAIFAIIDAVAYNTAYMPYGVLISGLLIYMFFLKRGGFKIRRSIGWLCGYAAAIAGFIGICALTFFTNGLFIQRLPIQYRDIESYCSHAMYQYIDDSGKYPVVVNVDSTAFPLDREDLETVNSIIDKYKTDTATGETFLQLMGLKKRVGESYLLCYGAHSEDDELYNIPEGEIYLNVGFDPHFTPGEMYDEGDLEYIGQADGELADILDALSETGGKGRNIEAEKAEGIEHIYFSYLVKETELEGLFKELEQKVHAKTESFSLSDIEDDEYYDENEEPTEEEEEFEDTLT